MPLLSETFYSNRIALYGRSRTILNESGGLTQIVPEIA